MYADTEEDHQQLVLGLLDAVRSPLPKNRMGWDSAVGPVGCVDESGSWGGERAVGQPMVVAGMWSSGSVRKESDAVLWLGEMRFGGFNQIAMYAPVG